MKDLTQVILQDGAPLALRPTLPVLVEDPAVPLAVDRDGLGCAGPERARLGTVVWNCRIWNATGSGRIATFVVIGHARGWVGFALGINSRGL